MQIHQPNIHSNTSQALCTRAKPNLPKTFNNTKYTFVPSVAPVLRRHQKTNGTTKGNLYVSLQTLTTLQYFAIGKQVFISPCCFSRISTQALFKEIV